MRLLIVMLLLLPTLAWGWEHKTDRTGHPVRFAEREITFHLPAQIPSNLDREDVEEALRRALSSWAEVSGLVLRIEEGPSGAQAGFEPGGENRNDILFLEEHWPYDANAVAVTVVTVDPNRHEIVDADILLNAAMRRFDRLPESALPGAYVYDDLQNTLTHEVGHALGLAHTDAHEATMFGDTRRGEISKRILSADDIDGIRALYLAPAGFDGPAGCSAGGAGLLPLMSMALVPLLVRRLRAVAIGVGR